MKYWNPRRVKRVRERKIRKEHAAIARDIAIREKQRRYTAGDHEKNAALMLDALGHADRRKMIHRLQKDGAMSLTKLARPFRMKLPTAHSHVIMLERAGIITTRKQGRVRMCIYAPASLKELAKWLESRKL